jgi:flagellar FliL protein
MAAAKEAAPPPPAEAAPPKKSKKMLIIIAGALVLVLVIVGAAVYVMKSKAHADADEETSHETTSKKDKGKKKDEKRVLPTYLKIDPYTINLKGEQGDQFLRLEISAEFEDSKTADEAKAYMPKLRNQTMLLLSGKNASDLSSKEQKEKLAVEIRNEMNLVLGEPESGEKIPKGPVKEILFTDFVIQ